MTTSTPTTDERHELTNDQKAEAFRIAPSDAETVAESMVPDISKSEPFNEYAERPTYSSPAGSLSSRLKESGEELTGLESCILDAAQTLSKKFQHGTAINRRPLGRVVMQYHPGLASYDELKAACNALNNRGLCRIESEQIRLVRHFGNEPTNEPSRFTRLVSDERLIEILTACRNCVGTGFDTDRNVAARAAVQSLVLARFGISRPTFKKRVRELIRLNVLEEVPSKGSTAFKLTVEASERMKSDITTVNENTEGEGVAVFHTMECFQSAEDC